MSGYIGPIPVPQGIQNKETFTATAGQTTFNTNGYTDGAFINVYLNGVRLINGTDYTATNGSDIVLTQAASVSDVLDFETFNSFSLASQQFENITTKNPTHEDTDGGRESALSFQGEQSGGEISTLAAIQASHDGTADDQKGDLIFKTNDGSDNNAPTERLRIDSDGSILTATLGTDNVHLGEGAGAAIASGGNNNVLIGKEAGTAITTGDRNVAIGHQALKTEDADARNVAIGYQALTTQNAGATGHNVAVGDSAAQALTTGTQNTAVGSASLQNYTTGTGTTAIGYGAGTNATTTDHSTLIGYEAGGGAAMTGHDNTFVGMRAGKDCTSGQKNVAVGREAMNAITTGEGNVAIGNDSAYRLTTGDYNIAIGLDALAYEDDQGHNVAVGWSALKNLNVPSADGENTAVGYNAGRNLGTALQNTFVGSYAGSNATSTDHSVCVGYYAGGNGTMTGHDNVCVGAYAGYNVTAGRNVLVGRFAGASNIYLTTGVANVIIGDNARVNSSAMSNAIVMGELVTGTGNNAFTFGNGATDSNIDFGATSITAPSDERYKEEIATSTAGLSFVNDLRPVTFKWKKAKDVPSDHEAYIADGEEGCDDRVMLSNGETNHGFIAQEVKTAIDNHPEIKDGFRMWSEDYREDEDGNAIANGRQRVAPAELIPILTKAIQELSAKNDALETRIAALEAE